MTAFDLLLDFAIMSLLLVVAQFLRAHIKPIQKLLLPCSGPDRPGSGASVPEPSATFQPRL